MAYNGGPSNVTDPSPPSISMRGRPAICQSKIRLRNSLRGIQAEGGQHTFLPFCGPAFTARHALSRSPSTG